MLVSDTGNNGVRRIDPASGVITTLMRVRDPRQLAVAGDGTIYVVEAASRRVVRYSSTGKRLNVVEPRFGDPYAVGIGKGVVYVVDTSATGSVVRVDRNGRGLPVSSS